MDTAQLFETKPGWLSRIFGLETAHLVACDAHWNGESWERGEAFRFLYRGTLGGDYLLTDEHTWQALEAGEARELLDALPVRLPDPERPREGA